MIDCNSHFGTFKSLTMNSSNIYDDQTLPSHEDEVNIPVVVEVVGASETDEQIPNQPPGSPVEVFTTTVINISEW